MEDRRLLTALFTPGDVVVEQINANSNVTTPTSAASPVFLSEYNTTGLQASPAEQVALPTAVSGSNQPLTISGTAASEGGLSLSANGSYLVVGGYDVAAGGATQGDTTVGLVDANGDVNTTTTTTLLSGNNTRGAASVDGSSVWVTGPNGVVYEPTGTNLGGTLVDSKPNGRQIEVVPAAVSPTATNQLFASTNKSNLGVQSFSPALPTTGGATDTVLNGMTSTNAPDSYSFFFANSTTMFVADATDGIQEWTLSGGTWSNVATLSGSYVGLTGVQTGNTVSLYATTGTVAAAGRVNGNSLISDTFTFNSGMTGTGTFGATTTLATAGSDYGFAGVAFAPQAAAVTPVVSTSSSTTAGTAQTVTVTATYATGPDAGQTDTGYTGTIAFTSSDPQVSPGSGLPNNYTFTGANNGVATFTNGVTLKTAGSQTITATDTSTGGFSSATVVVSPSTLHQLGVSAPLDATAGVAFSVTVTAQDQYGNTIPGYLGTVSFSGGGAGASLPSTYTFVSGDNGSHTFTSGVTLSTAAGSATGTNQTIVATDSGHSINGSAIVDDYAVSPFAAGDFLVYRVGTGSTNLTGDSVPVYLDEYNSSGTLIETDPLPPTSITGGNQALTAAGNALSEGEMSLSPNGEYLALTGYDTGINYPTVSASTSELVPRTVGIVGPSGSVNTTTALTDFSSEDNVRGAVTTNGTSIWVSGNSGGVAYTTLGGTTSTAILNSSAEQNLDQVEIVDGQLYVSSKKVTDQSLFTVGSGAPAAINQTLTSLPGVGNQGEATDGYFLTQENPSSGGPDTLYLTDSAGVNGNGMGDIEKYSFNADDDDQWDYEGEVNAVGVTGVTGVVTGTGASAVVTLYATTSGTLGETGTVYKFTDSTGFGGFMSGNAGTLVTAAANEAFRGVALVPQTPASTATHFVVSAPASVAAGTPFNFTITAENASGTPVPYTGTVNFTTTDSSTNAALQLPTQYTFTGNDSTTLSATLITAGTQTITGGGGIFGTSNSITVTPAAASTITVSAPAATTAGIAFSVTVAVEDQYGNLATNYVGTVEFSGGGSGASLPANYTFTSADAGTHTFTGGATLSAAAGSAAGTPETITATDTMHGAITGSATVDDYVVSAFTSGDIVVEQINAANNAVTPTGSASPVFLSEYNTTGSQSSSVETLPVWSGAATGSTNPLTLSGTAASEGGLSLSANGADLVLAGYDTAAGGTTQNNSTVALVNGNGVINTSTTTTLLSGNNTRSAASVDGSSVWVGGNNGVVYEPVGTSLGGTLVASAPNTRELEIAPAAVSPTSANQLFASTNKTNLGVQSFSPALPTTTGATNTVLNGMTSTNAPNTYAYFFANPTTMFVADANDGIQEWTLSSGTWTNVATLAGSFVGLTGVQSGNTVSLYATTGDGSSGRTNGNSLVSDTFTFNSGTTGTGTFGATSTLATAGANDGFAGVAFAPQASNIVPVVTTSPSTTAGNAQTVTVTAKYASGPDAGQTDTSYTGTIAFTSSDSQAVLPANYTFTGSNNGVATFSVTLKTAGSQTITATDTSSGTTSNAAVSVSPATLYQLGVSAPATSTAGIAFSVTVTAEDQYGNTIPGYLGTVSFSGGGGGATFPSSYTFVSGDNGSHTFTNGVKMTAGSATGTPETITATDSGNSVSGSASVDDFTVSNFTSGDIVVEQINAANNAVTPTSAASPVFLSEYNTTGSQSSAVQTVPIWSAAASGSNNPLTLSGTAASEGALSLSANGNYLVLAGYDTAAGGTIQGSSTVGLVNGNGVVDTSTTTALLSGNNTRGAASVDGTSVWVTGADGVVYETDGSSSGTLVDSTPNGRAIEVAPAAVSPTSANGLYASTNKVTFGVQSFSAALPTATGATNTTLTGIYNATAPNSYAFFFANPTTMFVADATDGIQEWTLSGGVWSSIDTLAGSYVGLTGVQSGNTVSLYATTGTSAAGGRVNGNSLISDTFTFNSGTTGTGTFGAPVTLATAGADDGFAGVAFAPAGASVAAPTVTTSASTGQTFTLGGTAKAVDSGLTVTSSDTDITGATDTITNFVSGDTLSFTNTAQITGSYASGVLTLTGSATPSQYTAALQSVTFSTTSTTKGTRTVDVVAHDSNDTGNAASNTGVDTVVEVISAPVVTGSHSGNSVTAGELASAVSAIDPSITVSSHDTDVTGATVTISAGTLKSGDTLNFTNTAQITGSYASGVLTLTGSATPSQYQAALQSITFSNATNTSTAARSVAFVVQDSNDTGNTNSNTVTETVTVTAPVTITGAYVSGSTWTDSGSTTNFDGYLVDESLGDAAMPIVGYALQTGANQLTQLPWATLTTITVQFSGPVSNIGLGSLKLVGGTGGGVTGAVAAPSVTGFSSSLGSNIYQWTLSSALGNNKYVMAIATTGSSFGTAGSSQVTDANGAGISGTPPAGFTSSSSAFPTGNGLADSTFDFFFNVLPGNGFQNGIDNSSDTAEAKTLANQHAESGGSPNPTYSPYFDFNGIGSINSVDGAIAGTDANDKQSSITSPTAPAAAPVGGTGAGAAGTASTASTTSITPLALGVIETGSSTSSSSPKSTVGNVVSASTPAVTTSASTGSTVGTGSGSTTSTTTTTHERDRHHHHLAATDEAVSDFDLADLWV